LPPGATKKWRMIMLPDPSSGPISIFILTLLAPSICTSGAKIPALLFIFMTLLYFLYSKLLQKRLTRVKVLIKDAEIATFMVCTC